MRRAGDATRDDITEHAQSNPLHFRYAKENKKTFQLLYAKPGPGYARVYI